MTPPSTPTGKKPNATVDAGRPLDVEELRLIDAWWRACNYLSVGMIYLKDNPLLKEPLQSEHVKHRLLGHWGASPASPASRASRYGPGKRTA